MIRVILERDLATQIGLDRRQLTAWRADLVPGEDWEYSKQPRQVWLSEAGKAKILARVSSDTPQGAEIASRGIESPAGHRYPDDQIPKGPQNRQVLVRGRPGWWTPDEAIVLSNAINPKHILVEFAGRRMVCRVHDARLFPVKMLIPVRKYDNVLVAARKPHSPGEW